MNLNSRFYFNGKYFTKEQYIQIKLGLLGNLDADIYALPELSWICMFFIRRAMENGIQLPVKDGIVSIDNMTRYAAAYHLASYRVRLPIHEYEKRHMVRIIMSSIRPQTFNYDGEEYNYEQYSQIELGLIRGVDVSVYANPKIPAGKMVLIRKGLMLGLNIVLKHDLSNLDSICIMVRRWTFVLENSVYGIGGRPLIDLDEFFKKKGIADEKKKYVVERDTGVK